MLRDELKKANATTETKLEELNALEFQRQKTERESV